jgi:hypothetical protein
MKYVGAALLLMLFLEGIFDWFPSLDEPDVPGSMHNLKVRSQSGTGGAFLGGGFQGGK